MHLQCCAGLFSEYSKAEELGIISNPEGQFSLTRSLNCCSEFIWDFERGITSWQKYFIYKIMILWHKHNKQLLMQIWSTGPSLEGKHFGTKESLYSIRLLLEEGYQSGTACSNPLTGRLLFTRIQISLPLNHFSTDAAVWNRNYFTPSQLVPHQIHQYHRLINSAKLA